MFSMQNVLRAEPGKSYLSRYIEIITDAKDTFIQDLSHFQQEL